MSNTMAMLSDVGYYARIGVNFDVSEAGLVRAYKRTALEHHPDRNGSTPEASQSISFHYYHF